MEHMVAREVDKGSYRFSCLSYDYPWMSRDLIWEVKLENLCTISVPMTLWAIDVLHTPFFFFHE